MLGLELNHLDHVIKVIHCQRKALVHGRPASCNLVLVVAGGQDTARTALPLRTGDQHKSCRCSKLELRPYVVLLTGNNKLS
jgi:hypothetical protein